MTVKKLLSALVLSALLVVGLNATPVFADHGSGDSTTSSGSTSGSQDSTNKESDSTTNTTAPATDDKNKTSQEVKVEKEAEVETQHSVEDKVKTRGDELLAEIEHDGGVKHSEDQRKHNCQAAEHGLETKLGNLSKNAVNHQTKIDNALSMALDFQKAKNLNPAGFDDLVAKAKAAQTQSASSIAALKALSTNLDCSSATVAQNVAQFKAAAEQVRNDLFAYRDAVKAVLTSLEKAQGGN